MHTFSFQLKQFGTEIRINLFKFVFKKFFKHTIQFVLVN